MDKRIAFSGIQPSGQLTLGNYIGALLPWKRMQQMFESIFCIVDLHAITVPQDPKALRSAILDTVGLYLACGIDPLHSHIFLQSLVPQHTQLAWIFTCLTGFGELNRMTQFKEKREHSALETGVRAGLFIYPLLMAADILLYRTDVVPVGADQKQHLELCRDLAIRFNQRYAPVLKVPEVLISETGARIKALQEPTKKMSKSDSNTENTIGLLDTPDTIARKLKRAVTDSDSPAKIQFDSINKPGVSNLLNIVAGLKGCQVEEVERAYSGANYSALKNGAIEEVIEHLRPIQASFYALRRDQAYLQAILTQSVPSLTERAHAQLEAVYDAIGIGLSSVPRSS